MLRLFPAVCLVAATASVMPEFARAETTASETKTKSASESAPVVQLAILLDTSGSMEGLINQARTQLWKIVNDLATARRDGCAPEIQVALYEYGKSSIPVAEGYLRQIVPLTDDLDRISNELFALTTNGGDEYCGQVIQSATRGLQWSESDDALKLIFIAGNEPFTQGAVNYKDACAQAIAKGITVNTIHCGAESAGISTGWRDGAVLADGSFLNINQDRAVATIRTPYDRQLVQLSTRVNRTYLAYGESRVQERVRLSQRAADSAALSAAPASAAERATFKGSGRYRVKNDLLAELESGKVKLEALKEEELPEALKGKDREAQKKLIADLKKDRAKIQDEIRRLTEQRNEYIASEKKKQASAEGGETFDTATIRAVRKQAAKKGFRFGASN